MKLAGLFPGQGAQSVGMGKAFFDGFELARDLFALADKALGYSISRLCFEGPLEELTLTKNVQPAILVTSYIAYRLSGDQLAAGAGHSLGEYSALVAAGSLGFEDAVVLVHKRGVYMQEAVQPGKGKMVAVMGPTPEEIAEVLRGVQSGVAEIANLNSPGQTVVAGDVPGVDEFSKLMQASGGKILPLNVSAPFHCSLMAPAARKLERDLDATTIGDPEFPIYCNVTAQPVQTGAEARARLKEQVCASVRWTEAMQNMIREQCITHTLEYGPAGVLSKLMKRIDGSVKPLAISDPQSMEAAHALRG